MRLPTCAGTKQTRDVETGLGKQSGSGTLAAVGEERSPSEPAALAITSVTLQAGSSALGTMSESNTGRSRAASSDVQHRTLPRVSAPVRLAQGAWPDSATGACAQSERPSGFMVLGRSKDGFNAAAAVASLAASREQRDASGDHELMDLQKRVQQLAEERLIAEDEKLVLGKPIGRGAFGMVFRGLWRNLDVAVKVRAVWPQRMHSSSVYLAMCRCMLVHSLFDHCLFSN